jgi:hypothetical protein
VRNLNDPTQGYGAEDQRESLCDNVSEMSDVENLEQAYHPMHMGNDILCWDRGIILEEFA